MGTHYPAGHFYLFLWFSCQFDWKLTPNSKLFANEISQSAHPIEIIKTDVKLVAIDLGI